MSAGTVGLVTYCKNCLSSLGWLEFHLSLSFNPITSSLTNGMPNRDTSTKSELPLSLGLPFLECTFNMRFFGTLALVQPPIIGWLLFCTTHEAGTSSSSAVTFFPLTSQWPHRAARPGWRC